MQELSLIDNLLKDAILLLGQKEVFENEKKSIFSEVEKAKKWIAKQPDYLKFLQHLQNSLHQKNIGAFSELLTYFVKDVLKKDKDIILDLYTYHNLPALRIEAINDGCRENIYEGNGGSIANIVSTGLRLIALSRIPHRKFIVLDEPDCWLKPDHVPFFAKIIGEISEKLKIQTVIISHHDWNYFKDYGRVIRLESDGRNLEANIVHDTKIEDEGGDFIKTIRLRQFMSHQDTVFELHPYLTCLIGENDIGKSVLATAIKAVAYNDSADSYIKHFSNEAQVLIELQKEKQILWQRFATTNQENPQKVKYSLFESGSLITSEFNSNNTPLFIENELNIKTTEDIDIHIGNQKQPVFLLSSDVKPQEKAKILSLGKESLLIQKMMENIKSKTKKNREIIKEGEKTYDTLLKKIDILSNVENLVEIIKDFRQKIINLIDKQKEINSLQEICFQMKKLENLGVMEEVSYSKLIKSINLNDVLLLEENLNNIKKEKKISDIENISIEIDSLNLTDTKEILSIIKKINLLKSAMSLGVIQIKYDLSNIVLKDERDFFDLAKLIESCNNQRTDLISLEEKEKNLKIWEEKINEEIDNFLIENKGMCPVCAQEINKHHIMGDKHD